MKCKYCQTELEEGITLCPACGKEQEEAAAPMEETPAEQIAEPEIKEENKEEIKATPGKIALAIAAGVVVLALLVTLVISGVDGDLFKGSGETIAPTAGMIETEPAETVPATIPPDGNPEDVTCKGSYTVSDEEVTASADTVVATIGEQELTVGQLQAYYWDGIYAYLQEYGDYAAMFGLDFAQSLDTQLCTMGDVSVTWQQYFLQFALDTWHSHQAMALEGQADGYELTDEIQTAISQIPAEFEEMAATYGYEDLDAMMHDYMGPGCSFQDYMSYMDTFYRGFGYLEHKRESAVFDAAQVEAFFLEHEADYAESGITKDAGKLVDVRHILLTPEGGTAAEDGTVTYSEDEWEACRAAAQDILDQWLAGEATEDAFAELANTHSTDPGSNTNGGLYNYVYEGQMVPEFNDWCFDEARQYGDSGLVKTTYGYHIMFYVGSQDTWYVTAEQDLITETLSALMPAAMEKYPMTVDYSAIKLGLVEFTAG